MECPNPACKSELFRVRVLWKQRGEKPPGFLPVILTCPNCKRQIKAYILNKDLRDVHATLQSLQDSQKSILEEIRELKEKPKKSWFRRVFKK